MELKEIRDRLLSLGLPVAYLRFKKAQKLPFIVYYESDTEIKGADNFNLYRDVEITIELYTEDKDPQLERRLENLFREVEIDKEGDTALENEEMLLTVFSFRTIQYIEEENSNA